jgi:hypothetical protein
MAAWKIREATQFIDQIPLETREFPPPKNVPGLLFTWRLEDEVSYIDTIY